MKKVSFLSNIGVPCKQVPTTQEDNHHGVIDKYDLYQLRYYGKSNKRRYYLIGTLIKYTSGMYKIFISGLCFDIEPGQILFE